MRTWTGCLTCRSRKVKCDGRRPRCRNCQKSQIECVSSDLVSFKHWRNPALLDGGSSSDVFEHDHVWVNISPEVIFLDETNATAEEYHVISHDEGLNISDIVAKVTPPSHFNTRHVYNDDEFHPSWEEYSLVPDPASSIVHLDSAESTEYPKTPASKHHPDPYSLSFQIDNEVHPISSPYDMMSQSPLGAMTPASFDSGAETRINARDGAQALLSMRHNGFDILVAEESLNPSASSLSNIPTPNYNHDDNRLSPISQEMGIPVPLTSTEDGNMLRQFSIEVGTWMDLSDLKNTFSKKVCRLAMQDPLLKAASIACAAKQQFLIGKLQDGMQIARKNYDKAITLLLQRLGGTDQGFASNEFAATVIFSCYEMLDAPTADWQRHLDGVFSVGKVRRVNGSSGGVEQAGFWSIARQEVVCAIINGSKLRLDPDLWAVDLSNIGQEGSEDLINNQVLTILAKVVNFTQQSKSDPYDDKAIEWYTLRNQLDHWSLSVKDKGFMDPISAFAEDGKAFINIWFAMGVCTSSWQMFHLAQILLLTNNPSTDGSCLLAFRGIEKQLLYHARQICGIAQSKPHGSCRVNSVQPIYFAGLCFNDGKEREGAIGLLEDIENELGWAAKYRAEDLRRMDD